jgi:hypothetical protein
MSARWELQADVMTNAPETIPINKNTQIRRWRRKSPRKPDDAIYRSTSARRGVTFTAVGLVHASRNRSVG